MKYSGIVVWKPILSLESRQLGDVNLSRKSNISNILKETSFTEGV